MKAKKLVLCLLLSVALVVTFIPLVSYAEGEAIDDQTFDKTIPSKESVEVIEDIESPVLEAKEYDDYDEIDYIEVTIRDPLCGTVVTGNDYSDSSMFKRQFPQPEITIPVDAKYELDAYPDENYGLWFTKDAEGSLDPFEGTMIIGQTYYAEVYLRTKADYADNTVFAEYPGQIAVNGGSNIVEWESDSSYFRILIEVQPTDHNYIHVVNAGGYLYNGTQYDQCSGCGAIVNKTIAPGWASYYVKGLKVAKGKGSMTVKWKKQSKNNLKKFNGYQVRYATKSDMSNAKYKTAGKGTKSKKISKLKKKTKYYVQVRTYTKTSAGTFYSKWSAKKTVKTK